MRLVDVLSWAEITCNQLVNCKYKLIERLPKIQNKLQKHVDNVA